MNATDLQPRRHEPPPGWPPQVFEAVVDVLAAALVATIRRDAAEPAPEGER